MNTFNQIKTINNNDIQYNKYLIRGNKYTKKPVKIYKTDEEKEREYFEGKNKKKY